MKAYRSAPAALVLATVALTGCEKAPTEEIAKAEQAFHAAEQAEASDYASAELETASATLDAANAEVETQNQRNAIMRSYDDAKVLLAEAVEKGEAARQAAVTAKAEAKAAAEAAFADASTSVEDAGASLAALVDCPRKPKGFAADLEALNGRLDAHRAELEAIEASIAEESFVDAQTAAETLSAATGVLGAELTSAREKLGC